MDDLLDIEDCEEFYGDDDEDQMDELMKEAFTTQIGKSRHPVEEDILIIKDETVSQEEIIENKLRDIEASGKGKFSRKRKSTQEYHYYQCERSTKPRGKSSGNPTETRANSCKAYVSFHFVEALGSKGCITRIFANHTGHNLENEDECHVNRICPDLVKNIQVWALEGATVHLILKKAAQWARDQGYNNFHDRRYYITPRDADYLRNKFLRNYPVDMNGTVPVDKSIDKLMKRELRADTLQYLDGLADAGRLPKKKPIKANNTCKVKQRAMQMIEAGHDACFIIGGDGNCRVPSESCPGSSYDVNVVLKTCNCVEATQNRYCKHLYFAEILYQRKGISVTELREAFANNLLESQSYQLDGSMLYVFYPNGYLSVLTMPADPQQNVECNCRAKILGVECVCILVAKRIAESRLAEACITVPHPKTSKEMIQELYKWAQSEKFTDSSELQMILEKATTTAFGPYSNYYKKRKIQEF